MDALLLIAAMKHTIENSNTRHAIIRLRVSSPHYSRIMPGLRRGIGDGTRTVLKNINAQQNTRPRKSGSASNN